MLTNTDYGTIHTFTYRLHLDTDYLTWSGGNSEPKSLLFCGEDIYLRSLRERFKTRIGPDAGLQESSARSSPRETSTLVVTEEVERFQDERYLWRLFGDAFWVREDPEVYHRRRATCLETIVPNDNDLALRTDNEPR